MQLSHTNEPPPDVDEQFTRADEQFTCADEQFTRADEQFTRADEQFTRADEQFTCADEQFTRADEQFTRADEQFTRADEQFTRADEQFTRADEQFNQSIGMCRRDSRHVNQPNTQAAFPFNSPSPMPSISWPSKVPTRSIIHRAVQVQYSLRPMEDPEIFQVLAQNIWDMGAKPYHWAYVPVVIVSFLHQVFWRQWILSSMYTDGSRNPTLKKYIRYMELILDELWTDLSQDPKMKELPESVVRWITIDSLVGRHSTERIFEWEEGAEERITDRNVSLSDWLLTLDNFPCQDILNSNEWRWDSVSANMKGTCMLLMESWLAGEHLHVTLAPPDPDTDQGKQTGKGKEKEKEKPTRGVALGSRPPPPTPTVGDVWSSVPPPAHLAPLTPPAGESYGPSDECRTGDRSTISPQPGQSQTPAPPAAVSHDERWEAARAKGFSSIFVEEASRDHRHESYDNSFEWGHAIVPQDLAEKMLVGCPFNIKKAEGDKIGWYWLREHVRPL
jgi:hypothetical protein